MPVRTTVDGVYTVNLSLVRVYVRNSVATTAEDIFDDAFAASEMGALEIISFCLNLRANPRTRRSMATVMHEWRRLR